MTLTRSHTVLFSAPLSLSVQGDPSETEKDRERRNSVFRAAQEMCDRRDAGFPMADVNMPSIIERFIHRIPEDRELEEATYVPTPYQIAAECMHKKHFNITMSAEDWAIMVAGKMRACELGVSCPPITRLMKERKRSMKVFTRRVRLAAYLLDPVKPEEMLPVVTTISPAEDDVPETGRELLEYVTKEGGTTVLIVDDNEDLWEALCRCTSLCSLKSVKRKLVAVMGTLQMKQSRRE